jgi:hypothetical protein
MINKTWDGKGLIKQKLVKFVWNSCTMLCDEIKNFCDEFNYCNFDF